MDHYARLKLNVSSHREDGSMEEIVGKHCLLLIERIRGVRNPEELGRRMGALESRWVGRLVGPDPLRGGGGGVRQAYFTQVVAFVLKQFFDSILVEIDRVGTPLARGVDFVVGAPVKGLSPLVASNAMEMEKRLRVYIHWILQLAEAAKAGATPTNGDLFIDRATACILAATSFGFWLDNKI